MKYRVILIEPDQFVKDQKTGDLKISPKLQVFENSLARAKSWGRDKMKDRNSGEVRIYEVRDVLVDLIKPKWNGLTPHDSSFDHTESRMDIPTVKPHQDPA